MKINYTAPINSFGYGTAASNIFYKLVEMGHDVTLFPLGTMEYDHKYEATIKQCHHHHKKFHHDGHSVVVYHQNQLGQHVGNGTKLGFPIFELEDFNELELNSLAYCDKLVTCSEWGRQVLIRTLSEYRNKLDPLKSDWLLRDYQDLYREKTFVVPLGVDSDLFTPKQRKPDGKTIFFNAGKWEERKGHDILIEAFTLAFPGDEPVELWMMCDNPFLNAQQKGTWEQLYNSNPKVKLIPRVKTHAEVAAIMQQTDCGVLPSLAEGWNLEALEMLSCGKQLIITEATAHTEFCNEKNAQLITWDKPNLVPAYDSFSWFHGQGRWLEWTEDQTEQLIYEMKDFHDLNFACYKDNVPLTNTRGRKTAEHFSWDYAAEQLIKALE